MTDETDRPPPPTTAARPSLAAADFAGDSAQPSPSASPLRAYVDRVRGGDMGALPGHRSAWSSCSSSSASLRPDTFTSDAQHRQPARAGLGSISVLAMGLVPVLLLGEIDLSAGVAGGVGGRRSRPSLIVDHGQRLGRRRPRRHGRRRA